MNPPLSNSNFLSNFSERIKPAQEASGAVDNQNSTHAALLGTEAVSGSVKTPELREVVTNQLSDEQRSSLETYREVTSEISQEDWDEFSERWEETEARFDSITDEISQLTGNTEFIDPKYEGEINAIIEQRPRSRISLERLLEN